MSDLAQGPPEFAAAMRGYDRVQVDDYVAQLHALLDEAEQRARAAESQAEYGDHATVGPRVTQIFDLAMAEAGELRTSVQAQADELLTDAQRRAEELVAAAERDAQSIMDQARAQSQEAVAESEGEREAVRRQVDALEKHKGHLVDELRRLQAAMASAADSVADTYAEPPAWNDEGETQTMEQPYVPPLSEPDVPDARR